MVHFFNREDEGQIAFVSMLISVALTLGIGIAIALLGYVIVFTVLFWLMTVVGISEIVAFTIAYAFGMGWCYATLLGYAFQAQSIYDDLFELFSMTVLPTVFDAAYSVKSTVDTWTGWAVDNAKFYVAGVVASFA